MIYPGDWLRSLETRDDNRAVKVLAIYHPGQEPGLQKPYATVLSRGRVSVFSLDRLEDSSRFQRVEVGA